MSLERRIIDEIPNLRRFARSLTRDIDEADDLVQASLERALGRIHLLRQPKSLRSWLFKLMYNLHINTRLKTRREMVVVDEDCIFQSQVVPAHQELHLESQFVVAAMQRLPEDQRAAISLTAIEGLSYQEAADILDIPLGTLMSRLYRGRTQLKALTEENPQNEGTATHLRQVK